MMINPGDIPFFLSLFKIFLYIVSGIGFFYLCYFFGGALGYNRTALLSAFRTDIYDVIRTFDDVQIVLDYDYCIAALGKLIKHDHKLVDIREMKSCGGLIKDVDGFSGRSAA